MDKDEKRMRIVHQNGNDGNHYGMTAKEARRLSDMHKCQHMRELEPLIVHACERNYKSISINRGLSEELSTVLNELGYRVSNLNKGGNFPNIEISW